jgi:hypothetical protein
MNTKYPIIRTLKKALDWQGISIGLCQIEETLLPQPDYPSIRSISNALDCWDIKHFGFEIPTEELSTLDFPFITYLQSGEYIWVEKINDKVIQYWSEATGKHTVPFEVFERIWNRCRIGLAFEEEADSVKKNYHSIFDRWKTNRYVPYSIAGIMILLWGILTTFGWEANPDDFLLWKLILLAINSTGLFLCYHIMSNGFRINARDFTANYWEMGLPDGSHIPPLSSSTKIFNLITWAELGFAYFSSIMIWETLFSFIDNWLSILRIFVLFALPVTVLSICMQLIGIGRLCWRCCLIILLSWINVGVCWFSLYEYSFQTIPFIGLLLLVFLIHCISAVYVRLYKDNKRLLWLQQGETAKIKYDMEYLKLQLTDKYAVDKAGFLWGNLDAANEIALFVDTVGNACDDAVAAFAKAIHIYPENRYRLIFATSPVCASGSYLHRTDAKAIQVFSALKRKLDTSSFFGLLEQWYASGNKRYFTLTNLSPIDVTEDDNECVESMIAFTSSAPMNHIPAIFINGVLLSSKYNYSDLFGIARLLNDEECTITKESE